MYIYVASSWRNQYQDIVCNTLNGLPGITCYDFKFNGFSWDQVNPEWKTEATNFKSYTRMLAHPMAQAGFNRDFNNMKQADAFILVLPAGRSANLEAGWAIGRGVPTAVFMPEYDTPDLMYLMANIIANDMHQLLNWVTNLQGESIEQLG